MVRFCCIVFTLFLVSKPLFPLVDYAVNYEYISTVLCENVERPELACNGKCHLMKELAKSSDSEDSPLDTTAKKVHLAELFCDTSSEIVFPESAHVVFPARLYFFIEAYFFLKTESVFHPPALI